MVDLLIVYPSNQGLKPITPSFASECSETFNCLSIKPRIETFSTNEAVGSAARLLIVYPSNQGLKLFAMVVKG
jgi:hypothetical protein